MDSPILKVVVQSAILSSISNVLAQTLTAYRTAAPYTIDLGPILRFVAWAIINTPMNYLWQSLIESNFPASYLVPSSKAVLAASQADEKELDKEEESSEIFESKLSWRNTAIKLVLDQTIGASFNTILFSLTFAGFKGASISESWEIAQRDFLGMILAGWRVWPWVSLFNFIVVKDLGTRNLVGSVAGMGWNIYLSLITAN